VDSKEQFIDLTLYLFAGSNGAGSALSMRGHEQVMRK
jgi:hypothetical protein